MASEHYLIANPQVRDAGIELRAAASLLAEAIALLDQQPDMGIPAAHADLALNLVRDAIALRVPG